LVARFEGPLVLYARRTLGGGGGDLARARDVVQEAFLRLCRCGPGGVAEDRVAAWLYTVCRRAALDVRRKERRMTLISDEAAERIDGTAADPAALAERGDSAARVMSMVERLPDNQREAIVLKFGHGLSYKEIAEVMGQSVSNVGVLIHVGMKSVRERLGVGVKV
jgi:RNA polymerase sigma-70 factor (ECF subfamily)